MKKAIEQYLEKHGFRQFCPKAVLFDMDGVIYDSMSNHSVSWHDSMSDYGLDMSYEDAYKYEGMRGVETIRQIALQQWNRELSDAEAQKMYAHKAALFAERVKTHPAAIMLGIKELMQQMKSDGLIRCVVTGSAQHALLDKLITDFDHLLQQDLIVTAFDVTHGKPHPEPYLKGMQKCGVKPWETIVVENAPLGVRAATAAQCLTVAVNTGPLPDAALLDEGADFIYPSMTDFSDNWSCFYSQVLSGDTTF